MYHPCSYNPLYVSPLFMLCTTPVHTTLCTYHPCSCCVPPLFIQPSVRITPVHVVYHPCSYNPLYVSPLFMLCTTPVHTTLCMQHRYVRHTPWPSWDICFVPICLWSGQMAPGTIGPGGSTCLMAYLMCFSIGVHTCGYGAC